MNIKSAKSSVVAGLIVTLIVSLQALVLAPILINEVGANVYGSWVVAADVFVMLQLFDFGLTAYSAQKIAAARSEKKTNVMVAHLFSTITVVLVLAVILIVVSFSVLYMLSAPSSLTEAEWATLRYCVGVGIVAVAIQLMGYSLVAPARALELLGLINIFNVLAAAGGFLLTMIMLYLGYGLHAAAYGLLTRTLIGFLGALLNIYRMRKFFGLNFIARNDYVLALREQIKNAPSTLVGNFCTLAISACDNVLIGITLGPGAVTVYSITKKLFDLCRTVSDILTYSLYGGLAAALSKITAPDQNILLLRYTGISFLFSCAIVLPAASFVELFVTLWVTSDMYGGNLLMLLIAAAAILSSVASFLFSALRSWGRFQLATRNVLIELIVKLILGFGLLPLMGAQGLPAAALFAALTGTILALRLTWTSEMRKILSQFSQVLVLNGLCAVVSLVCVFFVNSMNLNIIMTGGCAVIAIAVLKRLEAHAKNW